jgi:enoyl-CoA hydratase
MIKCEIGDGLCQLWLARADKANALTEGMLEAIALAATDAAQQGARALILTGEGKVFSAGADLDGMKAGLGTSSAWESGRGCHRLPSPA